MLHGQGTPPCELSTDAARHFSTAAPAGTWLCLTGSTSYGYFGIFFCRGDFKKPQKSMMKRQTTPNFTAEALLSPSREEGQLLVPVRRGASRRDAQGGPEAGTGGGIVLEGRGIGPGPAPGTRGAAPLAGVPHPRRAVRGVRSGSARLGSALFDSARLDEARVPSGRGFAAPAAAGWSSAGRGCWRSCCAWLPVSPGEPRCVGEPGGTPRSGARGCPGLAFPWVWLSRGFVGAAGAGRQCESRWDGSAAGLPSPPALSS